MLDLLLYKNFIYFLQIKIALYSITIPFNLNN